MDADAIRLRVYMSVFAALLLLGVAGFMALENLSLVDAVYFSIVTMATVGYGDIHPQSVAGKVLALMLIVGGVGTFLGVVASVTDVFVKRREAALRREKLNMVTGLFFSEMGNALLRRFAELDPGIDALQGILAISNGWKREDFQAALRRLERFPLTIDARRGDLIDLRQELQRQADFLLRLIENPSVQEHGHFTDLLRAIFHLRDELMNRRGLSAMKDADRRHLEGDIARAYRLLIFEWLGYMGYIKDHYGYLFSLALRISPFDPDADAVVAE